MNYFHVYVILFSFILFHPFCIIHFHYFIFKSGSFLQKTHTCKSCRSRQELSNEYLLAKCGFDTAEDEPLKVHLTIQPWDLTFTEPPRPSHLGPVVEALHADKHLLAANPPQRTSLRSPLFLSSTAQAIINGTLNVFEPRHRTLTFFGIRSIPSYIICGNLNATQNSSQ